MALALLAFGIGGGSLAADGIVGRAGGVAQWVGAADDLAIDVEFIRGRFIAGIGGRFHPTEFGGLIGGRLAIGIGAGDAESGDRIVGGGRLAWMGGRVVAIAGSEGEATGIVGVFRELPKVVFVAEEVAAGVVNIAVLPIGGLTDGPGPGIYEGTVQQSIQGATGVTVGQLAVGSRRVGALGEGPFPDTAQGIGLLEKIRAFIVGIERGHPAEWFDLAFHGPGGGGCAAHEIRFGHSIDQGVVFVSGGVAQRVGLGYDVAFAVKSIDPLFAVTIRAGDLAGTRREVLVGGGTASAVGLRNFAAVFVVADHDIIGANWGRNGVKNRSTGSAIGLGVIERPRGIELRSGFVGSRAAMGEAGEFVLAVVIESSGPAERGDGLEQAGIVGELPDIPGSISDFVEEAGIQIMG